MSYNSLIELGEALPSELLPETLSRIAAISMALNDIDNTKLALQCLADISVSNMPRYADFLYKTGEINQSLEIYAQYLGKQPEDLSTMLKLGKIYKEQNIPEGVQMVVEHVLRRDPQNQTAIHLRQSLHKSDNTI